MPNEILQNPIQERRFRLWARFLGDRNGWRWRLAMGSAFIVAYVLAARVSYATVDWVHRDNVVWLPAGLCTPFLTIWGRGLWPAVFLGSVIEKLLFQSEINVTGVLINASGNAIEALFSASILRWLRFDFRLNRLRDVLITLGIVCVGSGVISVSFGMVRRVLSEPDLQSVLRAATTWWLGNSSAALLLTPFLLTWSQRPATRRSTRTLVEAAAVGVAGVGIALFSVVWAANSTPLREHVVVLLLPVLIVSVIKFGRHGATGVMLLVGITTVVAATEGWGAFRGMPFPSRLWFVWLLLLEGMLTSLSLAAVLVERDTALKSLSRSEDRFRKLFEDTSDAVIVVDFAGRSHPNRSAGRLFGDDLPFVEGGESVLLEFPPEGGRRDCSLLTIDGGVIQADVTLNRIRTEEGPLLQLVIRDVSERRKAEAALLHAKQEAESVARAKDELLSVASHELRTPLSGIIGLSELSEAQAESPESAATARLIGAAGQRMLGLVNNILLLAEIEAGNLQPSSQPVDVRDILASIARKSKSAADAKRLGISARLPATPVAAISDPELLSALLERVVGNAVKFTDTGSVTLETHTEDHSVVITVTDTGCGIPAEIRGRLFRTFVQGDMSRGRRHEGAGLGLAVAARLARLLAAHIELGDPANPGSGTVVRILLPACDNPDLAVRRAAL